MRITIILSLTWFGLLLLGSCNVSYAKENDIGFSRIDPSSPLYFLKTIRENLEMQFAVTPHVRLLRQLEFATRRLREVKSLIIANRQDLIEQNLERYWHHIQSLPIKISNDKELEEKVVQNIAIHFQTLEGLYSLISDKGAKRSIRATINRITQRAGLPDNIKLPACAFLSKEASSSALNQTEKVVLLDRAQRCFNSLGSSGF